MREGQFKDSLYVLPQCGVEQSVQLTVTTATSRTKIQYLSAFQSFIHIALRQHLLLAGPVVSPSARAIK